MLTAKKMAKINKLSSERNKKMYKEFESLFNEKGLRIDIIYNKLSEKYFISASRVGKIITEEARKIREAKSLQSINNH